MAHERTPRANGGSWRWFRQDPALASALQAVLLTGEGGDIIAAMRAMNPHAIIETLAAAYGDLCEEASQAYESARRKADVWSTWQLILGVSTVLVILVSIVAVFTGMVEAAVAASALSFVTGSAAVWFDTKVTENRREADARFQDMVRYCTQSKLIMQLGSAMDGLDQEQQEKLIAAILGLKV